MNILPFLIIGFALFSGAQPSETIDFKKVNLQVGSHPVVAEVAKTLKEKQRGLMYRTKLEGNQGMLFVYEKEETLHFWMKNTFVPLSIGFFDKNKTLVDVQEMEPVKSEIQQRIPRYRSRAAAMYALEMRKNWFSEMKIKKGEKFKVLDKGGL